jgi:hypothetical protein
MEQKALVEGFNKSIEQHGLIYKFLVGDGDSSVMANVQLHVSYGKDVEKFECANHTIRCYTANLNKMIKTPKLYELEARKKLAPLIERLSTGARAAIRYCNGDVEKLKADFKNGPHHVFGDHTNCSVQYCDRKGKNEANHVPELVGSKVWTEVIHISGHKDIRYTSLSHRYK